MDIFCNSFTPVWEKNEYESEMCEPLVIEVNIALPLSNG